MRTRTRVSGHRFLFLATITISSVLLGTTVSFSGDLSAGPSVDAPRVTSIAQVTKDGLSKMSVLSDGTNIYVTEMPGGQHVITRLPLEGAQLLVPNSLPHVQALDVSPDGKKLLVGSSNSDSGDAEFWTIPVSSGSAERISNLTGRDAAWSPDGKDLVYSQGENLYVAKSDGSGQHKVFTGSGSVFAPRFSPDGKVVRFSISDVSQNSTSLWEVGRDGSNAHPLLKGWPYASAACCGRWSADGRYYIFQITQSTPATLTTLWALASSDSRPAPEPVQLTTGPLSLGKIAPSRDAGKIWAIGVAPQGQAVRYDAARKTFIPLLDGVSATDLNFSADEKWVAYVSVPDGALWRCQADGSNRLQLSASGERTALPNWSPDGKRIAYVSMQPGKRSKILIVSRDGEKTEELFSEEHGQIDANWSADGNSIMFGYLHSEHLDIKVADLKTHKLVVIPGSAGLFSPRWSPDGRYIAALSPDFTKVMLFDFQTQKWSNWFSEPAGAVSYPVWSSDSKHLYFDDLVTDEESIRSVEIGKSTPEQAFVLSGIERYSGPFGLWAGRMPKGSWMFIRDRSTQEVYQLSMQLP